MTWQRIDDDTYIDDTLVTCAEYQLFIDEMREQGKYFQPDHWTSYQFPDGKAREPILGVRYSSSLASCKWLSHRESIEWQYRLPKLGESKKGFITNLDRFPIGYWILHEQQQSGFAFVSNSVNNSRSINFPEYLERYPDLKNARNLDQLLDSPVDLEWNNNNNRDIIRELGNSDFDRASVIDRDIDLMLYRPFSVLHERKSDLEKISLNVLELIDIFHNHTTSTLYAFLSLQRLELRTVYDAVCSILLDIFTLQERMAGRSPAFEGIRLVKERIK